MSRLAAHHNLVRFTRNSHIFVACQAVPKGHIRIQLSTALVKNCQLKIGAQFDLSLIGIHLSGQHVKERGFARTIRPHKRNTVFALDRKREILED